MEYRVIEINGTAGHCYTITNTNEQYYNKEFAELACDLLNLEELKKLTSIQDLNNILIERIDNK